MQHNTRPYDGAMLPPSPELIARAIPAARPRRRRFDLAVDALSLWANVGDTGGGWQLVGTTRRWPRLFADQAREAALSAASVLHEHGALEWPGLAVGRIVVSVPGGPPRPAWFAVADGYAVGDGAPLFWHHEDDARRAAEQAAAIQAAKASADRVMRYVEAGDDMDDAALARAFSDPESALNRHRAGVREGLRFMYGLARRVYHRRREAGERLEGVTGVIDPTTAAGALAIAGFARIERQLLRSGGR